MTDSDEQPSLGPQYQGDDAFKARARRHQSRFRAEVLQERAWREFGNRLSTEAALAGRNFFDWPGMLDAVSRRFPLDDKKLYWDMLASDNVPFNVFVPLRDLKIACKLFELWTGDSVAGVRRIEIEWAPKPPLEYLDDNTSFDAYIEYVASDGCLAAIGVEVKYTEKEYSWGKTERERMNDPNSLYARVHRAADVFIADALPALSTKRLKQFWRNQLLGEAMVLNPSCPVERFTSVLLYPAGNSHFAHAVSEYTSLLRPAPRSRFAGVTYEDLIHAVERRTSDRETLRWAQYLRRRYLF